MKPGDTMYSTHAATAYGRVVKVQIKRVTSWGAVEIGDWKFTSPSHLLADESEALAKAEAMIQARITSLEKSLARAKGFAGNVKVVDRTSC